MDTIVIRSITKMSYLLSILGEDLCFEPIKARNGQIYFTVKNTGLVKQALEVYDTGFVQELNEVYIDLVQYVKANQEIRRIIMECKNK